jgi:Na+/H+ antiporter NhaD/arsenite permease-like protein
VLQTIAANLGSMLTPVGNPQNLYLYARYEMGIGEFFSTTLPITALSFVLILALCMKIPKKSLEQHKTDYHPRMERSMLLVSTIMFICCLTTVFRLVPWPVTFAVVLVVYMMVDRGLLRKVDYSLLATFLCFFVFTGNMGEVPWIQQTLGTLMQGRELWVSALASQVISNVPAAVLLSGFTEQGRLLLLGCDIGGLGTPVASLASLISYKAYCKYPAADGASYMKLFLGLNTLLLVLLLMIAQWVLV